MTQPPRSLCTRLDESSALCACDGAIGQPCDDEPADAVVVVSLDVTSPRQRMLGFGAAMTESSAHLIMSSPRRDEILDELFLPAPKGAGISLLRVAIGPSDFVLPNSEPQDAPPSRGLALVLPALRAARARNPSLRLIATPWSPPAVMKTSRSLVGGSLRPKCTPAYCRYLLRWLLHCEQHGAPVWGITLQNEPFFSPKGYPGCTMDAKAQAELGRQLVRMLRSNGLATRVIGHDHNYSHAQHAADLLRRAGDVLDGTAWHAYEGAPDALRDETVQRHSIFVTEITAHTQRPRDADFRGDAAWALRNVFLGPVLLGSRCGVEWNLALDASFGPHAAGGPDNCRGIVEVPSDQQTGSGPAGWERSPELYVLAHLAHATAAVAEPGGCWHVPTVCEGDAGGLLAAGFASAGPGGQGAAASLVLSNEGGRPRTAVVQLGDGTRLATLTLPPHSIVSTSGHRLRTPVKPPPADAPRVPPSRFVWPQGPVRLYCDHHRTYLCAGEQEQPAVYQSKLKTEGHSQWSLCEREGEPSECALRSSRGTYLGAEPAAPLCWGSWDSGRASLLQCAKDDPRVLGFSLVRHADEAVSLVSECGCLHLPATGCLGRIANSSPAARRIADVVSNRSPAARRLVNEAPTAVHVPRAGSFEAFRLVPAE